MAETYREIQELQDRKDRAEQRANEFRAEHSREQLQYDRAYKQREQPQQEYNPIYGLVIIGIFATFPKARRWLLIACGVAFLLCIILFTFASALPPPTVGHDGLTFVIFGLCLFAIGGFIGLWIPATIAANVVPKIKDRWLGTEHDDAEEEEDE